MKSIFVPGIKLINRFKYPQKFYLISILLVLFLAILIYLLIIEVNIRIDFTEKEKIGLEYIDPIKNLMKEVEEKRSLTNLYLRGHKSIKSELQKKVKKIDFEFNAVEKVNQKYNDIFEINKLWTKINNNWINLKKETVNYTPEEAYTNYTKIVKELIFLISYIGDKSNLIVDTEVDTFYLMYPITKNFPALVELIGQATVIGTNVSVKQKITKEESSKLIAIDANIKYILEDINVDYKRVFEYNKQSIERLKSFLIEANDTTNTFIEMNNKRLIIEKNFAMKPITYLAVARVVSRTNFALYEVSIHLLEELLSERISELELRKFMILFPAIITLLIIIYISYCFSLSSLNSISLLQSVSMQVADGNFDVKANIDSKDELGILSIYLNKMIGNLKTFIQREKILREFIISAIASSDAKDTIKKIVIEIGRLFNADRCFFVEYDSRNNVYIPIERSNVYLSSIEVQSPVGRQVLNEEVEAYTQILFGQKQLLVADDVTQLKVPNITKKFMEENQVKSFMIAPLFYASNPLGLLVIDQIKEFKKYTEEEKFLFESIVNQAAVIINQAKLTDQIQEKIFRESLLRRVTNNILESENREKSLFLICKDIGELFDSDIVFLHHYDKEKDEFYKTFAKYKKNNNIIKCKQTNSYPKEALEYISKKIFKDKELIIVNDINKDLSKSMEKIKQFICSAKAFIIAPISYKDVPLAMIVIANTETPKKWKKENLDYLTLISQQISIGINLFKLNDELKQSLTNEKTLRKITTEASNMTTHDEVDDYLLAQLLEITNADKTLHMHFKEECLIVMNEKISTKNKGRGHKEMGECLLKRGVAKEIIPEERQLICINDVEKEIQNKDLKNCLIKESIRACAIYPTSKKSTKESKEIIEITIVSTQEPKHWTDYEKNIIKLIIDNLLLVSLEVMQRQELEDTRISFIATLTHDLKSPIIAEQKALEVMLSGKPALLPDIYKEYIEDIYKTNEGLLKIVNNLLATYHYESGEWQLSKTEINISELIDESLRSLKFLAMEKNSEFSASLEENLPLMYIDKEEIQRVLVNLIGNAIRHTKAGTQISINSIKLDDSIQISIKDNGEGIPAEQVPMIFQRYPTKKRKIGTGLGLYLAKQIVEAHNGKIWFETKEGEGTTFYFTLPI